MKRTNNIINIRLALEAFGSDAYLILNKRLIKQFGLRDAVFLSNLIDKMRYFLNHNKLEKDGSFFQTHEQIMEETGLSEYALKASKRSMKETGIIQTYMSGVPAKERYILDIQQLLKEIFAGLDPLDSNGLDPLDSNGLYNKNKDNKNKDNNKIPPHTEADESTPSKKEKIPLEPYKILASQLSEIIRSKIRIEHPAHQIRKWAVEIRKLTSDNRIEPKRIQKALDWYANNIGGEYIPVIESGKALRDKFIALEKAIERERNPYRKQTGPVTGAYGDRPADYYPEGEEFKL